MNESVSLDDLALFLTVAECGSLSAAARVCGTPLPTLSRRMTRLEQDLGRALFLRGRAGYALSDEGRALAAEVAGLAGIRRRLARWQAAESGPRRVRITAGFWTSRHIALRLTPQSDWLPDFRPATAALDLARREADIGIRNRPPDHPWLARRKLRRIEYAVYGLPEVAERFISLPRGLDLPPSQAWLHETYGAQIGLTAADARLCLDLACRGFGRVVLPCFVGDGAAGLVRFGAPIAALAHDEWLVSHHEARHEAPIRAALTALAAILLVEAGAGV